MSYKCQFHNAVAVGLIKKASNNPLVEQSGLKQFIAYKTANFVIQVLGNHT